MPFCMMLYNYPGAFVIFTKQQYRSTHTLMQRGIHTSSPRLTCLDSTVQVVREHMALSGADLLYLTLEASIGADG